MTAESQRRLRWGGLIGGVLYGIAVALLTEGGQRLVSGAFSGLIIGNMVVVLVEDFAGIPRRPLIGGVVGAALAAAVPWGRPAMDALWLPGTMLSGFALGALLSAPPVRFPLAGGLLVALPIVLLSFVFDLISPYNPRLATLVTLGLAPALLAGIGWLLDRSTANFRRWAIGGAIGGLLFAIMLRAMPANQIMSFTKMVAITFGLAGAVVGAVVGIRSMDMAWPKLLARTKE